MKNRRYTLKEDKIIVKMFEKSVEEAHKGKPKDWARPHMIPNGACEKIGKVINRTANSVSSRIWNVLRVTRSWRIVANTVLAHRCSIIEAFKMFNIPISYHKEER